VDAKAGALTLRQARRNRSLPWLIVVAAGFIIVALTLALFVARLGGGSPSAASPTERAAAPRPAPDVTGTGPGLIQIAGQRYQTAPETASPNLTRP
jgi:hypothetical protein